MICKLNSVQKNSILQEATAMNYLPLRGAGLLQSCSHWFSIFQSSASFSFLVTVNSLSLCLAMFSLLYAKMKPLKYKTHSGRQFTVCLSFRALSPTVSHYRSKLMLLNLSSPST